MRVLFLAPAARTRFHQTVPLAWGVRARGHEVRVAGPPALLDPIASTGLPAVETAGSTTAALLDDVIDFAKRWRPHLVVHTGDDLPAAEVTTAAGARQVQFLTGHDGDAIGPDAAAFVDPLPAPLRSSADDRRLPMRHVAYDGPGVVPASIRRRPARPRICVSLPATDARLGAVLAAVDDPGLDVVTALPIEDLPEDLELPDNVRLLDPFPLHTVLPTCAAVIHDGEPAMLLDALAHALPQLILTGPGTATGLADRIVHCGAALASTDAVPLATLLNDGGLRDSAAALRRDMLAEPSPRAVAAALDRLVLAGG